MQFDTYSAAGSAELKRQPRWGSNPQSSALKSDLSPVASTKRPLGSYNSIPNSKDPRFEPE